jgi:hypothetical protein
MPEDREIKYLLPLNNQISYLLLMCVFIEIRESVLRSVRDWVSTVLAPTSAGKGG